MKRKISVGTSMLLVITAVLLTFCLTLSFAWTFGLTDDTPDNTLPPDVLFDEEKLSLVIDRFMNVSVNGIEKDDLTDVLLKGFITQCGDKYASYMTAEEYAEFKASYEGNFVGIGVTVQYDAEKEAVRVIEVIPDSPAEEAGFAFGDLLVAVNGSYIDYGTLGEEAVEALAKLIRGEEGTEVSVTVERDGEELTLTAKRAKVTSVSVRYEIKDYNGKKVAYIAVSSFDYPTIFQFKEAIDAAEAAGVDYVIYDLRNNGGGLLQTVNAMLTYILPKGSLITEVESLNSTAKHYAGDQTSTLAGSNDSPAVGISKYGNVYYNDAYANHTVTVPSAVLINGYSASAAELFTSALRDHEVATIVGENSYGKGCMQVTYTFEDGTALKLTTAFYNPPCGINYDKTTEGPIGIAPHVEVIFTPEENKNNLMLLPREKDRQFVAAFNALTDGEHLPVPDAEQVKA